MSLFELIAEVAPEHHDFIVKTASEVKASPFSDEIIAELDGISKKANAVAPTFGQRMGNAALGMGALVAANVAMQLAGDATDAIKRGITKSRNYKSMLEANPDLRQQSAKQTQKFFSVLHRFAPDYAGDPYVSGSFVRNQVNSAGSDLGQINFGELNSMVQGQKTVKDNRKMPMSDKLPWRPLEQKKQQGSGLDPRTQTQLDQVLGNQIARDSAEEAVLGKKTVRGGRYQQPRRR